MYALQRYMDDTGSSWQDKRATERSHQFADSNSTLAQKAYQPLLPIAQRSGLLHSMWYC